MKEIEIKNLNIRKKFVKILAYNIYLRTTNLKNNCINPTPIKISNNKIPELSKLNDQLRLKIFVFEKKLREECKSFNTCNFNNNINNLIIKEENRFNSKNKHLITKGKYNIEKNEISILKSAYDTTIYHELLHMSSSCVFENKIYSGFKQFVPNKTNIGNGLNEGYTSLLCERYFSNKKSGISYIYEKRIAEIVEMIIGREEMENLYFKGNLYTLVENLTKYDKRENVIKFLRNIDIVNKKYNGINNTNKNEKQLKDINKFLAKCIMKKSVTKGYDDISLIKSIFLINDKKNDMNKEVNNLLNTLLADELYNENRKNR